MKRLTLAAITLALSFGAGSALAQDAAKGEAAAKASGCMGCHDVNKKKVGPAFKEVNKMVADANGVVSEFKTHKVHDGIKGNVKDDDLKNIAAWIKTLN